MTRLHLLRRQLGIASTGATISLTDKENPMTISAIAQVPTASGSKYLQQLCKHWQHNMAVEFTPERGTVVFPKDSRGASWDGDGLATFEAQAETLDVRIDATSAEQLEGLKGAVARHLDRFAFREAPLRFDWRAV